MPVGSDAVVDGALPEVRVWGPERLRDVAALVADALPLEGLSADELQACSWDDPGTVVLGIGEPGAPVAAVVVTIQAGRRGPEGAVKLVVVAPTRQRDGLGTVVLSAAEGWSRAAGATTMRLGGSIPSYLWPGVDVRHTAMLCLAEACGYRLGVAAYNMSLPTTFRRPPPPGIEIVRALDDTVVAAAQAFADAAFPQWRAEMDRAIDQGGCFVGWVGAAEGAGEVIGFGCHSVNRAGWVGPMATAADRRAAGVGSALLGRICEDVMIAGLDRAEISWVGPVRFYAKAGAAVSRSFHTLVRDL